MVTDSRQWVTSPTDLTVHVHKLEAYSPSGTGVVFTLRDTSFTYVRAVSALTCDSNGDIWLVGWGLPLLGSIEKYWLIKVPYTGGNPPWSTNILAYPKWDITSFFPGMESDVNVIVDMAIDYVGRYIYILHEAPNQRGKISAFNMNTMDPFDIYNPGYDTSKSVTDVFSDIMRGVRPVDESPLFPGPNEYWHQTYSYAGLEIDHVNSDFEKCRIVAYAKIDDGSGGTLPEVVRLSNIGAVLSREDGTSPALRNFGLNNDADPTIRHLTFPGTNPLARLWDTPSQW